MTPKRWILAGCVAGLLVLLFVAWLVQSASSSGNIAYGRWKEKIQQIRALTKDGRLIPSVDLLKNLEYQRLASQARLDSLLGTLNKNTTGASYENSLAFKGDLFKVQRAILARAGALSIGVPSELGFKEFTGKEIPAVSQLDGLSFQLAKIKDFAELLMDCPVEEIKDIARGTIERERAEADEDAPFYQAFSFRVHFFCSPGAFQKFLSRLLNAGSLFVLDNLDARLRSEGTLEVEASVKAVAFSNARNL